MIKIAKVEWCGDYWLRGSFSGGTVGEHDFASVRGETGPMVEPLYDPAFFGQAFVEDGALVWPNGFDAAPGWLHREMKANGELNGGRPRARSTRGPLPVRARQDPASPRR